MEHILTAKGTMPKPETISGASIPEYIEIKTATGDTVAFLSPEADGVEAWIDDEQNGTCTLEMELPVQKNIEVLGEQDAVFSRNSIAYKEDGTQVDSGVPRFEDGVFGQGIMVEEGTTNVFSYPTFNTVDSSGGWNHWASAGSIGSWGQNTDPAFIFGNQTYSHWVENAAGATGDFLIYQAPSLGGQPGYSSIIFVCCMADGSPVTNDKCYPTWNGRDGGAPVNQWTSIKQIGTSKFYECRVDGIHQSGTGGTYDLIGVYIKPGNKVYFSRAQCERKSYATSFVDGTRAAEAVTVPSPQNVLSFQEGTISLWFKPSKAFWNGSYNRIIGHATAMNRNELSLTRNGTGSNLICYASDASTQWSGGTYSALQSQTSLVADTWYNLVFTWENGGKLTLYVNGVKEGQINYDKIPSVFGTLAVGYHPSASDRYANGIIDDLRIDKVCRSDAEILEDYQSNQSLPIDKFTTYKLSFDAHLKPTELASKWQYLTDQYRIYADDKEFVILNPDAVEKQRDGQKLKGKIKAHESWVLLGKKYQTICNDPLIGTPPWGAVIIVSGGSDLSNGHYPVGSAGHALYALLQGTGWTVGTVDVTGTYDLETEKESVLYNINQVQEKWGGILIWDSINKTVSLRDEATYKPYTGYQIRYAKNLKGISRADDYDIVTRLYPFGENDLNIANVNGGLLYLDNHSYSDDILEGVWYNQDIADQTQLKIAGEKQLAVMCRPRHNYKTEVLDLRSLPGYGHETFKRSDMVDLFDEDFGVNAQVRIIRYRHNVFQPWLCDMELGDPIEKIQATVAQTVLMAKFYKNVVAPNTSFQNLLKAIINTEATEINGASGDYTLVDGVSTWFDRDSETGELTGKLLRITPQGLIISHDGGQTWKLAISGEGIHADAGWVGKLNAGVVTIGADTTFEAGYDPVDNHLYFEYSVDGMNWHPIFNSASDLYMRQKVGDNGTWSEPARIAAVDGVDGHTPVKGVDYFDGVDGQDGTSAYLWVRYSQNANGNPMTTDPTGAVYIGIATTTTPSAPTSYTAYSWSLIKGQDGVPGEKGADGRTSYLHIKYSDENYGDISTGKKSGMSASSMYSSAYSPDNLVDGSIVFGAGTAFASASGAAFPQWHQIDLGGMFSINKVRWINNRHEANLPKDYTIAISETGAFAGEQTVVATVSGNTTYSTWVEHTFNPTKGRYVRMTVSAIVAIVWGAYYELAEWQIYGTYLDFTANEGETPGAYIGTYVDFNPVDSMNFNDYTWNKVKGTPIVWKGDLASPPSNPEENWVYRDTDNGYVYIYNGTVWELMVTDGADGIDGAPGVDGMSVYITYHNNPTDSQPATPTGDGTSGGWYTAPSAQANWMSQKVATNAYSGTWGAPILISGGRKFTSQPVPPYDVGDLWIGGTDGKNTQVCVIARATGSFVASDFALMTEPTVSMGVDSDCVGLWHFDGSLNSHKGVSAMAVANFDTGCFGQAVMVGGGTTNLVTNGDFSNGTTDWSSLTEPAHITQTIITENGKTFNHVTCRVTDDNIFPGIQQTGIAVSPDTLYTLSALGYCGGNSQTYIMVMDNNGDILVFNQMTLTRELSPGVVSHTFTTSADTTFVSIWVVWGNGASSSNWFKVTDIQLEQKAVLKIPTAGMSASAGTITFRAYDLASATKNSVILYLLKAGNDSYAIKIEVDGTAPNYIRIRYSGDDGWGSFLATVDRTTLTSWDAISVAWTSSTISLSVNNQEVLYRDDINFTLSGLGDYFFIGTDHNGNNAINTLVDELRVDKVYRDAATRIGWHKTGVPFYTSEDMKQWPGYIRAETDGLKVYDSSNALRVLVGSWIKDAIRKYGIKIIDGEIYSSLIRTGQEGDARYIAFEPPNRLVIYAPQTIGSSTPVKVLEMTSPNVADKVGLDFYDADGTLFAQLQAQGSNKVFVLANTWGKLALAGYTGVDCSGDFRMASGTKYNIEQTENYGQIGLVVRESPEQRYVDEGMGTLINGECKIVIDPIFLECIEPHTPDSRWYIQLTSYADVDLYVAEIGAGYFVVKERKDGTATGAEFTWSLSATRKDYALIRFMEVLD